MVKLQLTCNAYYVFVEMSQRTKFYKNAKINTRNASLQSESSSTHPALQNLAKFGRKSEREEEKRETWMFQCGLNRDENGGIISYIGTTPP